MVQELATITPPFTTQNPNNCMWRICGEAPVFLDAMLEVLGDL